MDEEKNTASLKNDSPLLFWKSFEDFLDETNRVSRINEKSLISGMGTSVAVKKDGQINISAGYNAEKKMSPSGNFSEISFSNTTKTNRKTIEADDLIINNHKLNNKLYELADYKKVLNNDTSSRSGVIGGLTMLGTVLTKSWDANLNRYVMIRRLVNVPVFSPSLGIPEVHPGLKITPSLQQITDYQIGFSAGGESLGEYAKKQRKTQKQIEQELAAQANLDKAEDGESEIYGVVKSV